MIIAGTVRLPPENLDAFRPHMDAMLTASRAEDGCLTYSYAVDVQDSGLIRVFEAWRDQAAIDAHFQAAHMVAWRASWPALGVSARRLSLYEVASEREL
ncbi:MAG: antibiotic biosynthesis monooxygenase [Alphaproteobacteria bacterium]|nr:antibiotic biosynthesis monooxygenase [Alphaproteobacteria bacterium]MBU1514908.1 antibiotic biosynthesis monooxygenase [Alphaproteobacteria bacterium]MBU2093829.1 antibiotic biosynthesis monooxygenase [Alphaproteobacteria bacterium]MBU2154077.1 antibiotic biosynthesis monooxygenase [Alphaproteobacteria bacterium]MBU2305410.1 antibiotic biosynthesis monooxygenase [Alphaproteobacteria bacterium]